MASDAESSCFECGEPCFLTEDGVSHHGTPDEIDYDRDDDHAALPEEESVSEPVTNDDCPQCLLPTVPVVGDHRCMHCGYAGDDTFVCWTCGNPATIDDDGLTRHLRRRSRGDGATFYDEEMDATHLPMPDPDVEPEDKPIWPI